jgi:hypothetical protein
LKIRCPMDGCDWVGEMSDKVAHLSKCNFICASCELCGQSILKSSMEDHLKECPQRKVCWLFMCVLSMACYIQRVCVCIIHGMLSRGCVCVCLIHAMRGWSYDLSSLSQGAVFLSR